MDTIRQVIAYKNIRFFDKGSLVVLGNGFQKKSQKTPKTEVERALKIKAEYESERRK